MTFSEQLVYLIDEFAKRIGTWKHCIVEFFCGHSAAIVQNAKVRIG